MLFVIPDQRRLTGLIVVAARAQTERSPQDWRDLFDTRTSEAVPKDTNRLRQIRSQTNRGNAAAAMEGVTEGVPMKGLQGVPRQPGFIDAKFVFAPTTEYLRVLPRLGRIARSSQRDVVVDMIAPDETMAVAGAFLLRAVSLPDLSPLPYDQWSGALSNLRMSSPRAVAPPNGEGECVAFDCAGLTGMDGLHADRFLPVAAPTVSWGTRSRGGTERSLAFPRVYSPRLGTDRTVSQSRDWSTGPQAPGDDRTLPGSQGYELLQEVR